MKIKRITKQQNKLVKLKLLNKKVYEKKYHLNNINIEDIEYRLKKALHVIYKYHLNNKRILFIGSSLYTDDKLKSLLKNTKHILVPEVVWMNGIITNQPSSFRYLSKNKKTISSKTSEILFQLKKKIDLIVILNKLLNTAALKEGYIARIPVISLNSELNILNQKSSYKIPGTFKFTKKKMRDNFFYSLLTTTLNKANRVKLYKLNQKYSKPKQKKLVTKKRYSQNKK